MIGMPTADRIDAARVDEPAELTTRSTSGASAIHQDGAGQYVAVRAA